MIQHIVQLHSVLSVFCSSTVLHILTYTLHIPQLSRENIVLLLNYLKWTFFVILKIQIMILKNDFGLLKNSTGRSKWPHFIQI